MAIVTTIATVSRRYYDKRNRSVAEFNVKQMCHALGRDVPVLKGMPKQDLITLALSLHNEFPE